MKKINLIMALALLSFSALANTAEPEAAATVPASGAGLSVTEVLIIALLFFAVVLLLVTVILYNAFKVFIKERNNPGVAQPEETIKPMTYEEWLKYKKGKPTIWTKLLSLKPIEQEKDMMIPHDYDGIKELNNPVPGWFNFLFYGTMIFGAIYLYYYHFSGGPNQDVEYQKEMEKAAKDKIAFLAKSSEKYDESSVKIEPAMIEEGKAVYNANCTACHGAVGEGIVGPNLTDEFWIHGGTINDVFKTIKYGVLDKGMTSWEKTLSSKKIAQVSNYIMSLQGSHPANAKAPQGEKYVPESTTDSVKNEAKKP